MQNEKDDDGAFSEIDEFEQEPFFIPDIYYLEESKSAEEFHKRLSKLIFDVPKYNHEELQYLSEVVSKPWKRAKGRPFDKDKYLTIQHDHFYYFDDPSTSKKKQDFINFIADKHKMDFDAARKAIAKALGPRRKKGEVIEDDLFPEIKETT